MSNTRHALNFIKTCESLDLDAMVAAVTDDILYYNIPMAPVTGKEAFRAAFAPFLSLFDSGEWEVLSIAETENGAVLNERVDHFTTSGGDKVSVQVMGRFEFDDQGKVRIWQDYFDMAEFQSQMPGA